MVLLYPYLLSNFGISEMKKIKYPTLEEVEKADQYRIRYWYRFLPYPGERCINEPEEVFTPIFENENDIYIFKDRRQVQRACS
jgi:hypothetical protein